MLRAPEPSDLDCLFKWENDPERLLHGSVGLPLSRDTIQLYIAGYNDVALTTGHIRFLFDDPGGNKAGVCDLYNLDHSSRKAFVSIFVDREYRQMGLASQAIDNLIDFARCHLGLHQLVAVVAIHNKASIKLFESKGFVDIARLPEWVRTFEGKLSEAIMYRLVL